jgi:hypothetical protein
MICLQNNVVYQSRYYNYDFTLIKKTLQNQNQYNNKHLYTKFLLDILLMSNKQEEQEKQDEQISREEQELEDEEKYD